MRTVALGSTGLEVSPLVFGGNVFGWAADEKTSFALLDAIHDAGLTFIDTADSYSRWVPGHVGGESETIIGKWLAASGKRDEMVIATKVGLETEDGRGLSKAYVKRAVEASLRRLQTDRIDLYQSHTDDQETPLEETMTALAELVDEGKVRVIGASNYSAVRLREAHEVCERLGIASYQTLQPNYNLHARERYETELEPVVGELGLGVINYYSLAAGFLTGKYRTRADIGAQSQVRANYIDRYFDQRGLEILAALDAVSARLEATPAQVALAWLIARPSVTAPIVSASRLDQLSDLVAAVDLTLDADAIADLDAASAY